MGIVVWLDPPLYWLTTRDPMPNGRDARWDQDMYTDEPPALEGSMTHKISARGTRRFLGNTNTTEVHDLTSERTVCQIDEILKAGHAVGFTPDTLSTAHSDGYDNCAYCIGASQR